MLSCCFCSKFCKLSRELLCVMPRHILFRRPAAAVPASVSLTHGGPASASARSVMVGDVLELVTEEAGGVAGSRALVTVHRIAEHGSMGPSARVHMATRRVRINGCVGAVACSAAAKAQTVATYTCAQKATPVATSATRTCTTWSGAWCRAGKSIRPG